MVNIQELFNEKKEKNKEQIKIRDENGVEGDLVIEDYPELKELYLRKVKSINRIVLKNLPQLQSCTIWDCGLEDLVIENCPQIKKLNVESNLLTNLEFLKDLNNLEELKPDGNTELIKILEDCYEGDWKVYRKNIQELTSLTKDLTKESFQRLLELQEELKKKNNELSKNLKFSQQKYSELKEFINEKILVFLSREVKKGLISELNEKIQQEEKNITAPGMTEDLKSNAEAVIESIKEVKKALKGELNRSKIKIEELEKNIAELEKTIEEKRKNLKEKKTLLEKLKKEVISNNQLEEKKKELWSLNKFLEDQALAVENKDEESFGWQLEVTRNNLKEIIAEQEINKLCQLQVEITKLELQLGIIKAKKQMIVKNIQGIYAEEGNITIEGNASIENNKLEASIEAL